MDLNYELVNLFPSTVHIFKINGFDEVRGNLIDYAYELKRSQSEGNIISNRGGWQSSSFQVKNEDNILHSLIINSLASFPNIKESYDMFVDAWININPTGSYNVKHNHPTSDLAGVLWVKCSKDCGDIVFDNPNNFKEFNTINSYEKQFKDNNRIYHTYCFPPVEGKILIFPSHIDHNVEENKSNEDRISVSFNIRLRE